MATFTLYNLIFATFSLFFSYLILGRRNRKHLLLSARVALLITVILYPWDFFAIRLGAWSYPAYPGWRLYGVPLNDLLFIWLCSYLTCVVLIRFDWRGSQSERHSESEQPHG